MQNFRALGAPPPDPKTAPHHCEFLATCLGLPMSAKLTVSTLKDFFANQSPRVMKRYRIDCDSYLMGLR